MSWEDIFGNACGAYKKKIKFFTKSTNMQYKNTYEYKREHV